MEQRRQYGRQQRRKHNWQLGQQQRQRYGDLYGNKELNS
jgi:hypothetical protein